MKLIFNKSKNAVELYLVKKKVPRDNLIINFSVEINKREFNWCKKSAEFDSTWGWPCLIRLDDLCDRENEFIDSLGRLKLHLEVNLTEIDASSDHNSSTNSQCEKNCETCAYYFNNNEYTDFTLVCSDGKSIPVHRVFLAKKSPVFKEMFQQVQESVELETTDSETMKEVLRFIYCGASDFENVKLITNVLRAAEKYEISELIAKCIEALMEQINKENAVEILDIAVLHCQKELEKKCLCMILKWVKFIWFFILTCKNLIYQALQRTQGHWIVERIEISAYHENYGRCYQYFDTIVIAWSHIDCFKIKSTEFGR